MEPRREENQTAPQTGAEPKRKRFRIVKLEDRIAPGSGNTKGGNCETWFCTRGGCTATSCPRY
jgi:hypothetical protein